MTKHDMITRIASQSNYTIDEVSEVTEMIFETIMNELATGRGIEFRNFGVFEVIVRKSRPGRNPKQADIPIMIPERVVVKFKPGKIMKEGVAKLKPSDIS